MTRPLREAVIDTDAIADNIRHLGRLTGTEIIAVVKADGYGHGAVRAARAALAGGASRLGVAGVDEALALRRAGIDAPILAWLHGPDTSFAEPVRLGIEIGVSSMDQLQRVADAVPGRVAGVHLKIETGLSRNGVAPADWPAVVSEAARLERVGRIRVIGLFSHLSGTSSADDLDALARFREAERIAEASGLRPPLRHLAATAAAISLPETRLNCVRIGIGMYGLSPLEGRTSSDLGLRPAMTLRAPVAAVRRVPAGAGVSYGYDHRAETETTLALVPLGYADGVPRQASGRGPVVIGGQRYRVAGRVAMDQIVVDVGDAPVRVGDEAVLFGDPTLGFAAASEWADAAGTIDYEIVTRIGARVTRTEAGA
ncbi:alanine racemase [uncultured Microbacterium sp.]|mgnify:CR=1 FL=1|uniref:alanine racemase n=1 Tax=uncultured Microbacterium sp. TaxID=191216 RepID=UPI0025E3F15A|nr:alanine racemase [uncultured Microbacterium sp.]